MPKVPDTNTFNLIDVYNSVHGHAPDTTGDLVSCFQNSVDAFFDPNYKGSKNSLLNFRNYTPFTLPSVSTSVLVTHTTVSFAYIYTVRCGGNVTSEGSSSVYERGVVYSTTNPNPTIGGNDTTKDYIGYGSGLFNEDKTLLPHGTTFYFRAYAINSYGTSYGEVIAQTIASRPAGLSNRFLELSYVFDGNQIEFFNSLQQAQEACYNTWHNQDRITGASGLYMYYSSFSATQTAYLGLSGNETSANSDKVATGYYIDVYSYPYKIVHVIDGEINSITDYTP
jgi:hypothetical protein